MDWTRRKALAALGAAAFAAHPLTASAIETESFGVDYLENLGKPGAINPKVAFIPPSKIDAAYSHVIYVNTATNSKGGQKMWVIERAGAGWKLALWDEKYWAKKGVEGTPPYSWLVSTGRHYPGEKRAGPTPLGIFNVDDRASRHRRGWGSPGMYNSIYIDLHYGGGRISGVAMHGTTGGMYKRLGRADSHGCVRMTQGNAEQVWKMFHPSDKPGANSPLWSEAVPRYFKTEPNQTRNPRYGYVRDGSILTNASGERLTKPGYSALFVYFRDDL